MAYIGKSPSVGVRDRYYYTTVGGETSISGFDDDNRTLVFTDGKYVDVMLNGITLVAGIDYVTTTTNTISGLDSLGDSDVVEVVVYDVFAIADTVSSSRGGTFEGPIKFNGGISINDSISTSDLTADSAQIITLTGSAATFTGTITANSYNGDGSQLTGINTDLVSDSSPQLGATLDANGNDIDMGTNTITDTKVGQWDTAYGWGDHALAGYADSTSVQGQIDAIITDLVSDSSPQLGGDLDVNGNNINFGDNNKATFGNDSDLKIYFDGTNSVIDASTDIVLDADGGDVIFRDAGNTMFSFAASGNMYANTLSLQSGGSLTLNVDSGSTVNLKDGGTTYGALSSSSGQLKLSSGSGGATALTFTDSSAEFPGNITAVGNITANSDRRLKDNIQTITNALEKVSQIEGVIYTRNGTEYTGVIAQDVEKVLPQAVIIANDEMKTKSVAYGNIVGLLIQAIKEQQKQIDELTKALENK